MIVIDAGGAPPAVWGELATESAVNKGLAGLVVYGAVRDTADIRRLKFPVWSTLTTSHAGNPHGLGEINQPIEIAGQTIMPGDWIVADDDGVMVLPKARPWRWPTAPWTCWRRRTASGPRFATTRARWPKWST